MKKLDLTDVTFLLVARFDTIQRLENAVVVCDFMAENLQTNIHLWEFDAHHTHFIEQLLPQEVRYEFHVDIDPVLHRTRHINNMVKHADTPYLAIWDIDVLASVCQIQETVRALRNGYDFAFPYKNFFLDTSIEIRNLFIESRDIRTLDKHKIFMNEMYPPNPVGGAFFANRKSYIECGMENEAFYGWGFEDGERYARWEVMQKSIARAPGALYHLTHPRKSNSTIDTYNEYITKNRDFTSTLRQQNDTSSRKQDSRHTEWASQT